MLFNNTQELAVYIKSITEIEDFSLFESDLKTAEGALKLNFLGDIDMAENETLQAFCKPLVAYGAAVAFIPQLDLLLTPSGFVVTSNNNQTPASKERVERLIATYRELGTQSIENLLVYLEKQDDLYEAWKTAKYCTRFDDMPCATNSVFTQYAMNWKDGSSIKFQQLYAIMVFVRERFFKPKIGSDFYSYILAHPTEEKITPIIHNFRQAFACAVMGDKRSADNIFSSVWTYIIENRSEYSEFDAWYEAPERWENDEDNHIIALGI